MNLKILMRFVAKNPPSILMLIGGLGWLLQGIGIGEFPGYQYFIVIGVILQLVWMGAKYKLFPV